MLWTNQVYDKMVVKWLNDFERLIVDVAVIELR